MKVGLTNGTFWGGLQVRMLRGASGNKSGRERDGLRARLAGVLGLLLRHATFISPALAATGLILMMDLTGRHKSMSTLKCKHKKEYHLGSRKVFDAGCCTMQAFT